MGAFAIVVMLPDIHEDEPDRVDFVSREFDTSLELAELFDEINTRVPNWRIVSFCHIEDLPTLMEQPESEGNK